MQYNFIPKHFYVIKVKSPLNNLLINKFPNMLIILSLNNITHNSYLIMVLKKKPSSKLHTL